MSKTPLDGIVDDAATECYHLASMRGATVADFEEIIRDAVEEGIAESQTCLCGERLNPGYCSTCDKE